MLLNKKFNKLFTLSKNATSYKNCLTTKSNAKNHPHAIEETLRVKIGLEVHARILSNTKIFSDADCSNLANSPINLNTSYFDAAFPGTMPTLNRRCVEASLITALALKCKINAISYFERKHYFYADLPAGYQITQQQEPIAFNGMFQYPVINPKTHKLTYKTCKIRRIQLEHDSAKSLQTSGLPLKLGNNQVLPDTSTLIDLNRAGVGLMEIVTEPDFESAFDCYSFVRELALTLKSIETCSATMNDGGFRVDVNVSLHKVLDQTTDPPTLAPGTRVELKNLNSFSSVLKGTEYEIARQTKLIKNNEAIQMETRTFDTVKNKTLSLRTKEDQYDYRFMPEPNLLPLIIYPAKSFKPSLQASTYKCLNNDKFNFDETYLNYLDKILRPQNVENSENTFFVDLDKAKEEYNKMDLPQNRRDHLVDRFRMSHEKAFKFVAHNLDCILLQIILISNDYKNCIACPNDLKLYVKVLLNEYLNQVNINQENIKAIDFELKCKKIYSYITILRDNLISERIYFKLFGQLFEPINLNKMAIDLVKENNLFLIKDEKIINEAIAKLFELNPSACTTYKEKAKKREKIFDFFAGRVHKELNELADGNIVEKLVDESLKKLL